MGRLQISICGGTSPGCKDEDNPSYYLREDRLQEAVLFVGEESPTRDELYRRFGNVSALLDNLFRVDALREHAGRVGVGFTLLTSRDLLRLRAEAERTSNDLASSISALWPTIIEALSGCEQAKDDLPKYAFLAIGCFSLDWAALEALSRWGYICEGREQTGGQFTVTAKQATAMDLRGLYWGSHTDRVEDLALISFGDHATVPRRVLPDVIRRRFFQPSAEFDSVEARRIASAYANAFARDIAYVLGGLASGGAVRDSQTVAPRHLIEAWLNGLGYITDGRLSVPYFLAKDAPAITEVEMMVLGEVKKWCDRHYLAIRESLAEITPLRHGIDYREVFVEIWHWVFGLTNRHLVEQGLLFDPYSSLHRTPGCVGAVAEAAALGW